MEKSKKNRFNRRGFLKGAAVGAAALVSKAELASAQATQTARATAPLPSAAALAAETEPVPRPAPVDVLTTDKPGADFMLDVMKSMGFEYIAANPGSSFRALHESIINHGGNKNPEFITCCHEESSVAIADGYARVEGRPMAVLAHGTVGLQHAAMTIYNAFVSRTPVFIVLGNAIDAPGRRPGVEWNHAVQDAAALVREFTKWDDLPISLTHFAESAVRAYKVAMMPPRGPVVIVADNDLQERAIENPQSLRIPKLTLSTSPAGDPAAVAEVARLMVAAENPLIMGGDAARTEQGMKLLIELAETLQAPVQGGKMPSRHPLSGGGSVRTADVILGLEVSDLWGSVNAFRDQQERSVTPMMKPGAKLLSISMNDTNLKSNYQYFQRYTELDMSITADAEETLPSLIEACKRLITPDRRRVLDERGKKIAAANAQAMEQARVEASYGWDVSPISTRRMSAELWEVIKDKNWASVGGGGGRLWNVDKHYQMLGGGGAGAMGSGLPIAVGAALAHKKYGRISVRINGDGDFMYAPGALWTAAHHKIPLLVLMHNNRAYHQEVMHITRMSLRHQRGTDDMLNANAGIGTRLDSPNINYAKLAEGLGVHGEGPITDPKDLGPALRRAVDVVLKGEPALVDVVTQPR
jgi:acetolactate synthase I/II/III large subunit